MDDFLKNVGRTSNDQNACRNTSDDNEFRDMQENKGLPPCQHETAKRRT